VVRLADRQVEANPHAEVVADGLATPDACRTVRIESLADLIRRESVNLDVLGVVSVVHSPDKHDFNRI
jgi:hypothetical protein